MTVDHDVETRPLVVACGALARDLRAVLDASGLGDVCDIEYLPANLHNRPEGIAPAVDALLAARGARRAFVAYADCGTGGALDRVLDRHPGVERLAGAHCYEVFAGHQRFTAMHDAEPGTFWLTDFLARHFDALVWCGLGLDRHPELRDTYFAHYTRVVLVAQSDDSDVTARAEHAAVKLGLAFERIVVGRDGLLPVIEAVR